MTENPPEEVEDEAGITLRVLGIPELRDRLEEVAESRGISFAEASRNLLRESGMAMAAGFAEGVRSAPPPVARMVNEQIDMARLRDTGVMAESVDRREQFREYVENNLVPNDRGVSYFVVHERVTRICRELNIRENTLLQALTEYDISNVQDLSYNADTMVLDVDYIDLEGRARTIGISPSVWMDLEREERRRNQGVAEGRRVSGARAAELAVDESRDITNLHRMNEPDFTSLMIANGITNFSINGGPHESELVLNVLETAFVERLEDGYTDANIQQAVRELIEPLAEARGFGDPRIIDSFVRFAVLESDNREGTVTITGPLIPVPDAGAEITDIEIDGVGNFEGEWLDVTSMQGNHRQFISARGTIEETESTPTIPFGPNLEFIASTPRRVGEPWINELRTEDPPEEVTISAEYIQEFVLDEYNAREADRPISGSTADCIPTNQNARSVPSGGDRVVGHTSAKFMKVIPAMDRNGVALHDGWSSAGKIDYGSGLEFPVVVRRKDSLLGNLARMEFSIMNQPHGAETRFIFPIENFYYILTHEAEHDLILALALSLVREKITLKVKWNQYHKLPGRHGAMGLKCIFSFNANKWGIKRSGGKLEWFTEEEIEEAAGDSPSLWAGLINAWEKRTGSGKNKLDRFSLVEI